MPSYKNTEIDFSIHYKAHILTINSSIKKCTQYNMNPTNHYNPTHVTRQTALPHTKPLVLLPKATRDLRPS